jgi:hypothetical protein
VWNALPFLEVFATKKLHGMFDHIILEASQKSSVLDAMMKITCDKESFNNEIRCLREALKRNQYDKENVSQPLHPRGQKG